MKNLYSFNSVRTAMCPLAKLCLSTASVGLTIVFVGIFYFMIKWQGLPWKGASLLSQITHLQRTIHPSISIVACFIHLHINNVCISRHIYWTQEKLCFQEIWSVLCLSLKCYAFFFWVCYFLFPSHVAILNTEFRHTSLYVKFHCALWIFYLPLMLSKPSYLKTINLQGSYSINRDGKS